MKQFIQNNKLLRTISGSLYSQETYRLALQSGKGVGFMYIFLVIALLNIPLSGALAIQRAMLFGENSTSMLSFGANGEVKKNRHAIMQDIAEQLPVIRFEKGKIVEPKSPNPSSCVNQ